MAITDADKCGEDLVFEKVDDVWVPFFVDADGNRRLDNSRDKLISFVKEDGVWVPQMCGVVGCPPLEVHEDSWSPVVSSAVSRASSTVSSPVAHSVTSEECKLAEQQPDGSAHSPVSALKETKKVSLDRRHSHGASTAKRAKQRLLQIHTWHFRSSSVIPAPQSPLADPEEWDILGVLFDPKAFDVFRAFSKRSLSNENLDFWTAIQSFKHDISGDRDVRMCQSRTRDLFDLYIVEDAVFQVNLPSHLFEEIQTKVGNFDAFSQMTVEEHFTLFDNAAAECVRLMERNLWSQFAHSDEFQQFLQHRDSLEADQSHQIEVPKASSSSKLCCAIL